ncbi:hypothetical protein D3C71_1661310 [compost metagenome]
MVSFIDDNHVEKVIGKLGQPFVHVGRKLVDVRDNDMGLRRNREVAAVERTGEWSRQHLISAQYTGFPPKAFLTVGDVHRLVETILDG